MAVKSIIHKSIELFISVNGYIIEFVNDSLSNVILDRLRLLWLLRRDTDGLWDKWPGHLLNFW